MITPQTQNFPIKIFRNVCSFSIRTIELVSKNHYCTTPSLIEDNILGLIRLRASNTAAIITTTPADAPIDPDIISVVLSLGSVVLSKYNKN